MIKITQEDIEVKYCAYRNLTKRTNPTELPAKPNFFSITTTK